MENPDDPNSVQLMKVAFRRHADYNNQSNNQTVGPMKKRKRAIQQQGKMDESTLTLTMTPKRHGYQVWVGIKG